MGALTVLLTGRSQEYRVYQDILFFGKIQLSQHRYPHPRKAATIVTWERRCFCVCICEWRAMSFVGNLWEHNSLWDSFQLIARTRLPFQDNIRVYLNTT